MAELIQCPTCEKDVSEAATHCPHCGHPIQGGTEDSTLTRNRGLGDIILFIVATAVVLWCFDWMEIIDLSRWIH